MILAATAVAPLPTDDACNPLPPGSLTGRAALVRRGTCTFVQKTQNVAAAGAVAIVVDDHTDEILVTGSVPGVSIPFIFITKASGEQIRGAGLPALMQWNGVATVVR